MAGHWALFAYIPVLPGRAKTDDATYHVCHYGHETQKSFSQEDPPSDQYPEDPWVSLGEFDLPAGGDYPYSFVGLNDDESGEGKFNRVMFDAVKWVWMHPLEQPIETGTPTPYCLNPLGETRPAAEHTGRTSGTDRGDVISEPRPRGNGKMHAPPRKRRIRPRLA
jgi:hypothetical protein